ncbi:MAG TPA: MATE family efflux transporter [Clostridiales bacterium]|nr:MATE family efflux transporter [Clostridiales bacterium]
MKEATRRQRLDMLNGPIWNKLPQFALPVAATAILGQLFNAADIAVVGNFTGAEKTVAVAAVGANSAVIGLIINLFIGIALGCNVVIAHAIGRGDRDAVHRAVHTSVVVAVIGGIIVGLLGQLIAAPLLGMLNVPDEVFPLALLYLRIYLVGLPVILLYNFEAAIFRSVGETRVPLVALTISGILNVVLNLFFVAVLNMSVSGVAIATVISNVVSSVILFVKLRRTELDIHLDLKKLRIDLPILRRILAIGLPAGVQSSLFSVSNIVIQSAINSLGTVVMAASSAAFNIEILTFDILDAFSQACTTFVGQNYGAGKIDRCKKTLKLCMLEGLVALVAAIAILLFFGKPLLSIFNNDPEVVETGYIRLMYVMFSHIFNLLYNVMSGYLRGFSISLAPAILTMLGVCGVRIAWIHYVFPLSPTFKTIMIAYPVSLGITALMIFAALLYCRPSKRFEGTRTEV